MIRFSKLGGKARFLSPLKDFQPEAQPIEYREDPLMGLTSVVRTGRRFWQALYQTDEELVRKLAEESRGRCFFCPEKVSSATPKFLPDFIPQGRLRRGESWLFPNLFAQKEFSAIAVIARSHYLPLDEFSPQLLADGFKVAGSYIRQVHQAQGVKYAEIGSNYLFPAGASIMHPHFQVLCSGMAYYLIKEMERRSQLHFQEYAINFWEELIETEKKEGARYLGRIGDSEWFLPFAPTREDEVNAVVRGKSHFLEFDDGDWDALGQGLSRVLRYYKEKGLSCFNFALYSGSLGEPKDYLWAGLKIVSRTSAQAYPVSDIWYSANLLMDGFVTEPPEELALELKKYFPPG